MRTRPAFAALAAALAALSAAPLRAQTVCDGRPIREIRVTTASLFGIEDEPFPPFFQRMANSLHWRTRPRFVARDLLFRPGDLCDERRLEETARLLRSQGYIRTANVTTTPAPGGAVDVQVRTRDDWSLEGSLSWDPTRTGKELRRLRLTEDNVLGRGMQVQLRYRNTGREPGFDVQVTERHFVRRRQDATFFAGYSGVGYLAEQSVVRAFETEFDRFAWRESARYRKEPFPVWSAAYGVIQQPVVALGADAGVARRFGTPGRLLLTGIMLSGERVTIEGGPQADRVADDSAATAAMSGRWTERRRLRLHAILGVRSVRYERAAGLDAVNALEDVREGVEIGIVLGKTLGGGLGLDRDLFTAVEGFAGVNLGDRLRLYARGKAEGRYLTVPGVWDGVLASAQALGYFIFTPRSTFVWSVAGAGGWHTRTPFQLQLAGPSGVRGYGYAGHPAGRRVVARGEHRYFAGTVRGAVDVGLAGFADLGQGWAGDAIFGENSDLLASVGGGVRLAFPSGSRRTFRIDLAFPTGRNVGPELRIGFGQQFGLVRGEPDDVVRSRESVSSATVFNFPRF